MVKKKNKIDFDINPMLDNAIILDHLKSHYRSILRTIKKVYFNKDNPESLNFKYDPQYPNALFVIKNGRWESYAQDYILDTLILNIWSQLYNGFMQIKNIEDYKMSLSCDETYQRIEGFMDEFRDFCNKGSNPCWIEQKKNVMSFIVFLSKKIKP